MKRRGAAPEPRAFIQATMRLAPVPSLPDIQLYASHPGTGLWRLDAATGSDGEPPAPYWAFVWAGGLVLARFLADAPGRVAGRRVLDFGAGSGLVAIAAAQAGAAAVSAAEIDPNGIAALTLNAAANGVTVIAIAGDLVEGPPPAVDIVLAGDVFYAPEVAARVLPFLERCLAAGVEVLVGDPRRAHLPEARLRLIAEYQVPDFGQPDPMTLRPSGVFELLPAG